jgi:hypothetical protein
MASRIIGWIQRIQWARLWETFIIWIVASGVVWFILERSYGTLLVLDDAVIITCLVVGSLGPMAIRPALRKYRAAEDVRFKEGLYPSEHPMINAIILSLKHRARRLYFQAQLVLLLILGTLGAGIYVFATAERLTRTPITRISEALERTRREISMYRTELSEIPAPAAGATSSVINNQVLGILTELQPQIEAAQKTVVSRADDFTTSSLVSTLSTRVGIVLMILFLVQILVTMYRYNSRLAAHLEGRAVALQLASLQQDQKWQITELINLFSGDSVDFGKLPPTAIQSFADLLKQAAATASKKTPS